MRWQSLSWQASLACVCVCACICISVFDFCRSWRIFNLTCCPLPLFSLVTMKSINLLQCLNPIYHFANFSRSFSTCFFLFLHDAALFVGVSPPCPMLHNFNQPFMKWQTGVADWRLIHAMLQYNFIRARNVAYE